MNEYKKKGTENSTKEKVQTFSNTECYCEF